MRVQWALVTTFVMALEMATVATGASAGQTGTAQRARGAAPPKAAPAAPAAPTITAVPKRSPGAGPVIVFETVKGTFEMETYPNEAPKTVAQILALVKRNFYNGLRVHRVEPGFLVQFGDPLTRDMTKKEDWGTGGSGRSVGVSEVNPKRPHKIGAVGIAWAKDPKTADSQIYVVTSPQSQLNARYTVFGQVISGMDVIAKLRINDVIRRATV
jgi:peptidyl-prolyl cis-trans isomerase B (cyclophilin B)